MSSAIVASNLSEVSVHLSRLYTSIMSLYTAVKSPVAAVIIQYFSLQIAADYDGVLSRQQEVRGWESDCTLVTHTSRQRTQASPSSMWAWLGLCSSLSSPLPQPLTSDMRQNCCLIFTLSDLHIKNRN